VYYHLKNNNTKGKELQSNNTPSREPQTKHQTPKYQKTMTSKLGPRATTFVARWGIRKSLGLKTSMDLMKATNAALVIQRKWRTSVSNPEFMACRNRLRFEFNTISKSL
jgi:hypothetical protein